MERKGQLHRKRDSEGTVSNKHENTEPVNFKFGV